MYPCDNNDLLNFVCIHPEGESQGGTTGKFQSLEPSNSLLTLLEWNKQVSLDQILKVYHDFDPKLLALFKKADPESLKVWKLLDMDVLPTWIKGKLVILGDAAHPFLPRKTSNLR